MAIDEKRIRELALQMSQLVEANRGAPPQEKPRLRLIVPDHARPPALLDEAAREAHLRRIRFIAGRYGIYWLVDQELEGAVLEDVSDERLLLVRRTMEKALKCVIEGVSFDDAGLVRWAC